jgi:hypothetical protein
LWLSLSLWFFFKAFSLEFFFLVSSIWVAKHYPCLSFVHIHYII